MICNICTAALTRSGGSKLIADEHWEQTRSLHPTFQSFAESARSSCFCCKKAWAALSPTEIEYIREAADKAYSSNSEDFYLTTVTFAGRSIVRFSSKVMPFLKETMPTRGNAALAVITWVLYEDYVRYPCQQPQSNSTFSDKPWTKVDGWMRQCLHGHDKCAQKSEVEWFPTRLIHIQPGESSLRLITTADTRPSGPYVTLSHCWGTARFIQLLRANIEQLSKHISLKDLPQTFQDAVAVARRLGVHYLWIDSLCILQDKDDLSDWFKEAALMEDVYANSYCNISALAAIDNSKGLFFSRNPRDFDPFMFTALGYQGVTAEHLWVLVNDDLWKAQVTNSPLNSRGWVLQERLLAPRVLHFGQNQLFWECCSFHASECYPNGLPPTLFTYPSDSKAHLDLSNIGAKDPSSISRLYKTWREIVKIYSTTNLTKITDRLVALSGLAKKMQNLVRDKYLAGLWLGDLPEELFWTIDHGKRGNGEPSRRHTTFIGPSWSWVSVDGRTSFHDFYHDPSTPYSTRYSQMFSIEDVKLEYMSEDRTGIVRGGYLDLKGWLHPFCFTERLTFSGDDRNILKGRIIASHAAEDETWGTYEYDVVLDATVDEIERESPLGTMFVLVGAFQSTAYKNFDIHCLLLRVVDKDKGVYERIGVVRRCFTWTVRLVGLSWAPRAEEEDTFVDAEEEERLVSVIMANLMSRVERVEVPYRAYDDNGYTIRIL